MEMKKPPFPPMDGKAPMDKKPPMGMPKDGPGGPPPGWTPPMADISWVKRKFLDVPYAHESKAQCFDLYLPEEGDGPFPLVIHIHGGGFAIGDKRDDHMDAYLKGLHRGWAVASVEYRLSGEAIFPAAVLDCREALRYIYAHASEFSVDPEKICTLGGSAGGNLAAMMGMNIPNGAFPGEEGRTDLAPLPTVKVCIDQFGPMNFKTMDDQARANGVSLVEHDEPFSPESKYLGVAIPDAPQELIDAANPANWASDAMAPILVQHGTVDRLVPYAQSPEFVAALEAKGQGDKVTFTPIEGADHEDKLFVTDKNLKLVFDFLDEHV